MIDANTRLFLLNFVYLKAAWDIAFNPAGTHHYCFYSIPDRCQQVKFMYNKRELNYTDSEEYKSEIFEIPFKVRTPAFSFLKNDTNSAVFNVP